MDDDQSTRDRVAGQTGLGGPAGDNSPSGGASAASEGQAAPGQAASGAAVPRQAESGDAQAGQVASGGGQTGPETKPAEPGQAQDEAQDQGKGGKSRSFWRELPVLVVVALAIALVIKTFVVQAFFIPSSSMEDTLLPGDKVLVNKLVFHLRPIQSGDIIVFDGAGSWDKVLKATPASSDPLIRAYDATLRPLSRNIGGLFGTAPGQTDYIKRVIGVPGDHVACCNAKGQMTVNGVPLHEKSYLYPGAEPSQIRFSVTVPPGRLWVMGDNRLVSDDSRLHTSDPGGGTIPENMVIGRAFVIVWPPSRWRILPIPSTFNQRGITKAAAAGALTVPAGGAAPILPLAGGFAVALPVTWLERRMRLRRRPARRG
ncbi:MAG TPA: signal peptidase I [Streptosporangiaceae bacterium]|jgi:signal peptidase I